MNDVELMEQIVADLEAQEQKDTQDQVEFRERYDLLVDCAIDELNDEIIKMKLNDPSKGGTFDLVTDGKHSAYKGTLLSSHVFVGGEVFSLKRVERGVGAKSLLSFVFEPVELSHVTYLVMPYEKALTDMDANFARMLTIHLLPTMNSIELDVVKLQHEFADRKRKREIDMTRGESKTYSQENSWC